MNFKKIFIFTGMLLALSSCASTIPRYPSTNGTAKPLSKETTLYSWTSNPTALVDPTNYILGKMSSANACIKKINASSTPVPGCEGNGLFAGPGVYTVDDPFTSADYGDILVISKTKPSRSDYTNASFETNRSTETGVKRQYIKDISKTAILYDFRASNLNTKALVVRSEQFLADGFEAVKLAPQGFKKFQDHIPYQCGEQTTVVDVLKNWGDHIRFLTTVFFTGNDSTGENFIVNNDFNDAVYAAAFASDAVAMTDSEIQTKIAMLKKNHPDIMSESFEDYACIDTGSVSPRACLARRIFHAAVNDLGFGQKSTYTWDYSDAAAVFKTLGLFSSKEVTAINSAEDLKKMIKNKMLPQYDKIKLAYECAKLVEKKVEPSHLGLWP